MAGYKCVNIALSVLFTIVILPCLPFLGIFFVLPILCYRAALIGLRKAYFGNSGKIVSPLSAFFAADRMYSEYPLCNTIVNIIVEGKPSFEKLREAFLENAVMKRDPVTKELEYPELRQKVVAWGGFLFWENDPGFHINNHFRHQIFPGYENKPITKDLYVPFLKSLLRAPFKEDRSPWEIIVIHDYKEPWDESDEPKTLLVYRLHHTLAGGYSTMNLLLAHDGLKTGRSAAVFPKLPLWQEILWNAVYIFRGPYEMMYNLIDGIDFNEWKLPAEKLRQAKSAASSRPISVQYIKDIKNRHNTSFSAVIASAITGGMRDYMIARKMAVPKSIHIMMPWPVRNVPEKLGNFLTGVILELPIGDPDPVSRMHKIQKNFIAMKYSTVATTNYYLLKVMGRLFYWFLRPAHQNLMSTTIMSNVAGPDDLLLLLGHPLLSMSFVGNFMCANVGLGFTVLSYHGKFTMVCGGDEVIMPHDSDAEELMEKMELQFKILEEAAPRCTGRNDEKV